MNTITLGPKRKKGECKWRGRQIDIFAHVPCRISDPNPDLVGIQGGKKLPKKRRRKKSVLKCWMFFLNS
jgi:hypothetical protein